MPLADFVRYLNSQLPDPPSVVHSPTHFVSENGRVHARYAGLRLESAFFPMVATRDGRLRGHRARLQVVAEKGLPLDPEVAYVQPRDDQEFIALDRLVRTLHTLNYLIYRERQSLLLLKVHPHHVASVAADHGLAFEEILRSCGLMPEQITLEFDVDNGSDAHLRRAIASYQSRGYGIAIGGFARHNVDFSLLEEIRPAIVKVDPLLIGSLRPLLPSIDQLHALGALVLSEIPYSLAQRRYVQKSSVDLLLLEAPPKRLWHASNTFLSPSALADRAA